MKHLLITFQNTDFALRLASELALPLHYAKKTIFADGELEVTLEDPSQFSGATVSIVHATSNPVSENILSISFLAHELKNADAARVVAIIPYLGYARQTESAIAGKPGNMAVVAHLLEKSGIDEIYTVEVHTQDIHEFFTIPVHSISAHAALARDIQQRIGTRTDVCLVAPDEGARNRVVALANELGLGWIVFSKERYAADTTRLVSCEGVGAGSCAIIIDDIIATGGTAVQVCDALHAMNVTTIAGYFVHPVFAGNALEKIRQSHFDAIVVGNTIPLSMSVTAYEALVQCDMSSSVANAMRMALRWPIQQSTSLSNESSL